MAIRRCPYCKAIIDEADKYCNNCGTQLLFPEDEYVEEDIPGDKITEEEEEDEEEENDEGEEEEVEEIEEVEGWDEEEKGKELEEEEEFFEEAGDEEDRLKEEELKKKYEVALEDDELIFKTKDLEKLTRTVDEGEKEVDELIAAYRRGEEGEEKEEDEEEKKLEAGEEERPPDTREDLPPWVSGMKEARPPVMDSAEIEETEEEEEEEEREEIEEMAEEEEGKTTGEEAPATPATGQEWTQDSGIGVPESVTQAGLAFTDTTAVEAEAASEDGYGREGEKVRKERTLSFSMKMKSKFVDFVFITAIWLISLWFTAQVIDVSFFRLFSRSPLHVLGFYFILLLLYFFLFLYFLGETLGDHYFSAED